MFSSDFRLMTLSDSNLDQVRLSHNFYGRATLDVLETHDEPRFWRVRSKLGLLNAEYHTTVVPVRDFIGVRGMGETDRQRGEVPILPSGGTEFLESRGYRVLSVYDALHEYGAENVPREVIAAIERDPPEQVNEIWSILPEHSRKSLAVNHLNIALDYWSKFTNTQKMWILANHIRDANSLYNIDADLLRLIKKADSDILEWTNIPDEIRGEYRIDGQKLTID